jgi:hypothetical protein
MVRKFLAVALGSTLMSTVLVAPATADTTTVLDGHDEIAAEMFVFRDRCSSSTSNPPQPTAYGIKSGSIGTHSLGWQYPFTDYEVGALGWVPRPASLTVFTGDMLVPDGAGTGHTVAIYYDDTPGYTGGYWIGWRGLTWSTDEWATYNSANGARDWFYYNENGALADQDSGLNIRDFAESRGGDGGGAWVGGLLGCDGERLFQDRLRLGRSGAVETFDFEGRSSRAHLEWSTDGRTVKDGRLTLKYGQKVWMLGHMHGRDNTYFTGKGTMYAKAYGSSRYRPVATHGYDPRYYAAFRMAPKRETTYRFASGGNDIYDSGTSETITVKVRAAVRGKVQDKTLRQGQNLVVKGKLRPGNKGAKLRLERKVGGHWKTLTLDRTGRGGKFTVSTRATQPGKWKVRVKVANGKGNLGNKTRPVKVTVKKRVPPPPLPTDVDQGNDDPDVYTPPVGDPLPQAPPDPTHHGRVAIRGIDSPITIPSCILPGPYLVPCRPSDEAGD